MHTTQHEDSSEAAQPNQGVWKSLWNSPMVRFGIAVGVGMAYLEGCDPLSAQTAPDEPQGVSVSDTVVVTASRIEQPLSEVTTHLTVVEADVLAQSAGMILDDVLRQVPGFSLFRRSSSVVAHPTSQGVSLRGIGPSGASRTLVLLDGVPLNDPFGGWIYWSRVGRDSLERVEIARGGASNVWGSSSLGGTIQLITSRPQGESLRLRGEAGERGTLAAEADYGRQSERGGFLVRGSSFDTDGYHVLAPEQRGSIDVPAFSEHTAFGARGDFQANDSVHLFLRGDRYDEERGNGTQITGNETEADSFSGGADFAVSSSGSWSVRLFSVDQEFVNLFSAQADDRESENPALDQFLVDAEGVGLSALGQYLLGDGERAQRLTVGADWSRNEGTTFENFFFSNDRFNNQRQAGGEQTLLGVFAQDQIWLGDKVLLQIGARYDEWDTADGRRFEFSNITGDVRRDDAFEDRDDSAFSPRLGLVAELGDGQLLRAAAYRSFRAPTNNELYRPFRVRSDITAANELLVPETLTGAEVGYRVERSRFALDVTAFLNELEDPIANVTIGFGPGVVGACGFTPGGGSCRQRQNLGETRVQGLELDLRGRIDSSWSWAFQALSTDAEVQDAPGQGLEGLQLAQVPELQASFRLDWSRSRFDAGLVARWVDEQFEDDLNQRLLDDFTVVDFVGQFQIDERWSVFAAVENATDEEIQTGLSGNGLLAIGTPRLARAGVRLRLTR